MCRNGGGRSQESSNPGIRGYSRGKKGKKDDRSYSGLALGSELALDEVEAAAWMKYKSFPFMNGFKQPSSSLIVGCTDVSKRTSD